MQGKGINVKRLVPLADTIPCNRASDTESTLPDDRHNRQDTDDLRRRVFHRSVDVCSPRTRSPLTRHIDTKGVQSFRCQSSRIPLTAIPESLMRSVYSLYGVTNAQFAILWPRSKEDRRPLRLMVSRSLLMLLLSHWRQVFLLWYAIDALLCLLLSREICTGSTTGHIMPWYRDLYTV